jgi:hypothetical protein
LEDKSITLAAANQDFVNLEGNPNAKILGELTAVEELNVPINERSLLRPTQASLNGYW